MFQIPSGRGGGYNPGLWVQYQVEHSTRSTNRSFKRLIKVNNVAPEDIYKAICSQTVELVFTAHPTQASRPRHGPAALGRQTRLGCLVGH